MNCVGNWCSTIGQLNWSIKCFLLLRYPFIWRIFKTQILTMFVRFSWKISFQFGFLLAQRQFRIHSTHIWKLFNWRNSCSEYFERKLFWWNDERIVNFGKVKKKIVELENDFNVDCFQCSNLTSTLVEAVEEYPPLICGETTCSSEEMNFMTLFITTLLILITVFIVLFVQSVKTIRERKQNVQIRNYRFNAAKESITRF